MSKVACLQINSGRDIAANLAKCTVLLEQAARLGVRLVLLPENVALLSTSQLVAAGIEERTAAGPIRNYFAAQAKRLGLWLVVGSVPIAADRQGILLPDRVRAACLVYDDQGQEVARYDKIHLFDVDVEDDFGSYRESATIAPGEDPVVVNTPVGKVGLSICYDLRFPELYRQLVKAGAEIFTVPAAFTAKTGAAHWHTLLKARAIENLCYVLAAGEWGEHGRGRQSYGHSMIIDPWGQILAEQAEGDCLVVADLDMERQQILRRQMPVLSHRRL